MAKSIEGGVVITNTLSTKNDGDYPLVFAESVKLADGKTVEDKITELDNIETSEALTPEEINQIWNQVNK